MSKLFEHKKYLICIFAAAEADQHRCRVIVGQKRLLDHLHQPEDGWASVPETPGGHQGLVLSHPDHGLREQEEEEVLGERSHISRSYW